MTDGTIVDVCLMLFIIKRPFSIPAMVKSFGHLTLHYIIEMYKDEVKYVVT